MWIWHFHPYQRLAAGEGKPEGFPLAGLGEEEGAQVTDRVGAVAAPAHAAAFQTRVDDSLAGRFHWAATDRPTLLLIIRIVHAMDVVDDVLSLATMDFHDRGIAARQIELIQRLQ